MAVPVVIAQNGFGTPVKAVSKDAPALKVATNGIGIPVVISNHGAPFIVEGLGPADTTAPILSLPTDAANGHNAYTGTVTTDEAGGLLFHVATTSATPPTATQIAAGMDHLGLPAASSGANSVGASGVRNVSGSGLLASTVYYLHFTQIDAASNVSNVVSGDGFTTTSAPDVTGPTLSSGTSAANGQTAYTGTVSTNEAGTLWHLLTATSAPASVAAIKAGTSQAMGSTGVQNVSGSGLSADTTRFIQYYAEDASGNGSNIVVSSSFTTDAADSPPVINSATLNASTSTLSLAVSDASLPITVYWQVRPQASAAPDQAAMIANTGGEAGGNYSEASVPASEGIDYSAAADGTKTIYVMVREDSGLYSAITDVDFTKTTADTTAPALTSATDAKNGQTASTGSVSTDEGNGTLYWVVTTSSTAPTAAQVKLGQDNSGTAAADSGSQAVSGTGSQAMAGSGLAANTAYTTHFMHEDSAANQSVVVSASGFTTDAAASGNTADVGFDNSSAWIQLAGFNVTGSELVLNGTNAATDWAYMSAGNLEAVTGGGTVDINLNVASFTGSPSFNVILYFYQTNDESQYVDAGSTGVFSISSTGLQTAATGISVPAAANYMQCAIRAETANMTVSLSEIVIS